MTKRGWFFARSASGYCACRHEHRTFAAARRCADGIHHSAVVVFTMDGNTGRIVHAHSPESLTAAGRVPA